MKTATQHQGLTSKYEYGTITINKTNEPEITISGRFATMTFGNSTATQVAHRCKSNKNLMTEYKEEK